MTGYALLDLAMTAVSLFNAALLLWLALSVLLNAERRTAGLWAAAASLLLGSLFFLIHTVIVGYGYIAPTFGLRLMWRLAWLPITALPFAWYGVVLWYSGFWDSGTPGADQASAAPGSTQSDIRQRHRPWFWLTLLLTFGLLLVQIVARPLPSLQQILAGDLHAGLEISGIPAFLIVYPLFALLCVWLTVDALRRPAPSILVMGDLARRRARPWLLAASIALLLVSFLVAGAAAWIVVSFARIPFTGTLPPELGLLDLLAALLISAAILLVGQATVSYEIFTGKTLPRRSLRRAWYWAIGLSAAHSLVLGSILQIHFPQVYTVLLAALLTVIFFALQNRDAFQNRDDSINTLRPFVSSQGFVEHILAGAVLDSSPSSQEFSAFTTLCRDVLNTRQAALLPAGRLALLAGGALHYPAELPPVAPENLAALPASPGELVRTLDPPLEGWAAWVVPLGSRETLSGWLLLAGREDGDLYTQEQIEFARAAGERLIDQRAGAEMARRLVALQRQRVAESQLLDQRTRRVLHDEVLPALHSALLSLNTRDHPDAVAALSETHRQIAALLRELPGSDAVTRAIGRLGLVGALQEAARSELDPTALAGLSFESSPQVNRALADLPPLAAEVVFFAAREGLRNAARHARHSHPADQPFSIRLQASWQPDGHLPGLLLTICDNGAGLSASPAENTSPGAQQGLALHSAMLAVLGGSLELGSQDGQTCLTIWLPEQVVR